MQSEVDPSLISIQRLFYDIVEDTFLEYNPKNRKEEAPKRIDGASVRMFSLAGSKDYPDIAAWYQEQPEAILPFGVEWTFTKKGDVVFKIPATFLLASYAERGTCFNHLVNPSLTLLRW